MQGARTVCICFPFHDHMHPKRGGLPIPAVGCARHPSFTGLGVTWFEFPMMNSLTETTSRPLGKILTIPQKSLKQRISLELWKEYRVQQLSAVCLSELVLYLYWLHCVLSCPIKYHHSTMWLDSKHDTCKRDAHTKVRPMVTNTIARCQCCFLTLKLLLSAMLFEIPSAAFQNVVTVLSDHRHVASTCNGLQRQTFEIQALHCPGLREIKRPIHALICIQLIDEAASCGFIQRDKMRKRDL